MHRDVAPEVRKAVARALQAGLCTACSSAPGSPGSGQALQVTHCIKADNVLHHVVGQAVYHEQMVRALSCPLAMVYEDCDSVCPQNMWLATQSPASAARQHGLPSHFTV